MTATQLDVHKELSNSTINCDIIRSHTAGVVSFRVNVLSEVIEAKLLLLTDTFVTSACNIMVPLFVMFA